MKCDHCDNQATVHLIEIQGGKKVEKHLCEVHAVEEGVAVKVQNAPINELLEKFVLKHSQGGEETGKPAANRCEGCGMTYEEFRKSGLLGCAQCYETFEKALTPLLERAHEGASRHLGKVPTHAGINELRQQRLRQLRRELEEAVAAEQYERAAKLRDRVNEVESEKA
ncbi:MAG: UvrB/UvrC motif-containing protein [Phycisphaeraceae bacterium]